MCYENIDLLIIIENPNINALIINIFGNDNFEIQLIKIFKSGNFCKSQMIKLFAILNNLFSNLLLYKARIKHN